MAKRRSAFLIAKLRMFLNKEEKMYLIQQSAIKLSRFPEVKLFPCTTSMAHRDRFSKKDSRHRELATRYTPRSRKGVDKWQLVLLTLFNHSTFWNSFFFNGALFLPTHTLVNSSIPIKKKKYLTTSKILPKICILLALQHCWKSDATL